MKKFIKKFEVIIFSLVFAALIITTSGVQTVSALTSTEIVNLLVSAGLDKSVAEVLAILIADKTSVSTPDSVDSSSSTCYNFTRDLKIGDKGADVAALQVFLVKSGYLTIPDGTPKGYYGNLTMSSVAKYQSANGISPATGYFGALTRKAVLSTCTNTNQATNVVDDKVIDDEDNNVTSYYARCGSAANQEYSTRDDIMEIGNVCGTGSWLNTVGSGVIEEATKNDGTKYFWWQCTAGSSSTGYDTKNCYAYKKAPVAQCGTAANWEYEKVTDISTSKACGTGSYLNTVGSGVIEEAVNAYDKKHFWWQCTADLNGLSDTKTCYAHKKVVEQPTLTTTDVGTKLCGTAANWGYETVSSIDKNKVCTSGSWLNTVGSGVIEEAKNADDKKHFWWQCSQEVSTNKFETSTCYAHKKVTTAPVASCGAAATWIYPTAADVTATGKVCGTGSWLNTVGSGVVEEATNADGEKYFWWQCTAGSSSTGYDTKSCYAYKTGETSSNEIKIDNLASVIEIIKAIYQTRNN